MIQKEITLKSPVILCTKEDGATSETNKISLREPTAGDLRGLSLKTLLSDNTTNDWVIFLNRISSPKIPLASFDIMTASDFVSLVFAVTQILNGVEEETKKEDEDGFSGENKGKKLVNPTQAI
jgi:hypothetical protein